MTKPNDIHDDLFESSTMTFGEHLDELRKSLLKASVWLAIGLAAGLYFANSMVQYIQTPLQAAITRFLADQTLYRMGHNPKDDSSQAMRRLLINNGLVFETVYVIDQGLVPESPADASPARADDKKAEDQPSEDNPASDAVPSDATALAPSDIPSEVFQDPHAYLKPLTIWRPANAGATSFQMEETFMIWLKAALVIGAVAGSPGILYHIWHFVAAGLYPHERKYVYVYMPFSVALFVSGVVLAFFLVLHYVLDFLLQFNTALNVDMVPRLSNYVNFVLLLPLGFGIAFQLPLVMLFLQRIGLFETSAYIASWRIAVLVIAILSMVLTPADIYSMIALMVPLIVLYFLGIALCKFMPTGKGIGSQGYDPA